MVLCIQKHLPTHMLPFISKGPQSEENSTESQNLTMKKKLDARYYKKKKALRSEVYSKKENRQKYVRKGERDF